MNNINKKREDNKYIEAKQDFYKAYHSVNGLTPQQKKQLLQEIGLELGIVALLESLNNNYFRM